MADLIFGCGKLRLFEQRIMYQQWFNLLERKEIVDQKILGFTIETSNSVA